jgi:hypothetical protein
VREGTFFLDEHPATDILAERRAAPEKHEAGSFRYRLVELLKGPGI